MTYKTRADLVNLEEFYHLDTDTEGNPIVWENHYQCPCGEEWTSDWSCKCNDTCGGCNTEIEPCESFWIGPEIPDLRQLWEDLPEAGMDTPEPAQSVPEQPVGASRPEIPPLDFIPALTTISITQLLNVANLALNRLSLRELGEITFEAGLKLEMNLKDKGNG